GYAVDWSRLSTTGKLATGDVDGKIFTHTRADNGSWISDSQPFTGHTGSVEEIQWSPTEKTVFASASSDHTVKIWDTRLNKQKPAVSVQVADADVNVLSWSNQTAHLLASGHDDGSWAVWDLRQWKPQKGQTDAKPSPVASFNFHKEQITSLEWHPTDDSIILAASGDNTLTLWDLAVELDDEESQETAGVQEYPPQLLFVHWMEQVKEGHWHPQIPGAVVATVSSKRSVYNLSPLTGCHWAAPRVSAPIPGSIRSMNHVSGRRLIRPPASLRLLLSTRLENSESSPQVILFAQHAFEMRAIPRTNSSFYNVTTADHSDHLRRTSAEGLRVLTFPPGGPTQFPFVGPGP
ncbi:hypothetical protein LTS18_008213, partial [Coniosporium uncinatum]